VSRLAVFVSGEGTNLQALLEHPAVGPCTVLVVSDRPDAPALERARRVSVDAVAIDRHGVGREAWDAHADALLRAHAIDLVVLAGFRRLLGPAFVAAWRGRVVNVHPSLLPSFPGMHALRDALEAGVPETGVTVHWVDEGMDTGPVISQRVVQVLPGDDEASLRARVQAVEHLLLPATVASLLVTANEPG
jgi:phosphoribosylglycinamide formyltransferase-1